VENIVPYYSLCVFIFKGRLLHDKSLRPDIRVRTLNVLAAAALKDDVILLLHQDRREHVLMNYAMMSIEYLSKSRNL